MLISYNWLKDYLGASLPAPEKIEELLTFHSFEIDGVSKVDDDIVFDVDVLPNRSSDCLSHRGIARELATLLDVTLKHDPLTSAPDLPTTNTIEVAIDDAEACPRFTASLVTGIKIQPSPAWLQDRLKALGQRPINNVVDATNYVMYAIGQPLHAYDAKKFPATDGVWKFGVRLAREGETVSLLAEGGKDEDRIVTLTGEETLITDASSDTPIGLAGVKGGAFAGVDDSTSDIIIEAAHFDPIRTRKTARGLGIVIDASKRFENEPSRELPLYAQHEIIALITKIAGGEMVGCIDEYLESCALTTVEVRPDRVESLLGVSLGETRMMKIMKRLGADVSRSEAGTFLATGPFERTDLLIEEDFIEEIGRIYGLHHIESVVPEAVAVSEYNPRHYYGDAVRSALVEAGFSEVITSSFRNKDQIQLKNALASDKSFLRSDLTKGLTEALDKNAGFTDLLGASDTRVFEIGTVFSCGAGTVHEHVSLSVGARIKQSGYTAKDDALVSEAMAIVETALGTNIEWAVSQGVAECNFSAVVESLSVPTDYAEFTKTPDAVFEPYSLYPYIVRDIAMWVPEGVESNDIESVLNEHAGALRVRTTLFDEFSKEGRTSYAFRLVFQSKEKTLTDDEVNAEMERVTGAASERGWEVR